MKIIFAASLALLVILTGCFRIPEPAATPESKSSEPSAPASSAPEPAAESSEPETSGRDASTPDGAAEALFENIKELDHDQINELVGQYFEGQVLPDAYFALLKPISERISHKIGAFKVDGDKATVDISVTAVDAQKAISGVMPGAFAHLAAMQMTGKEIGNLETVLAEYAAENIKWDTLPTIRTDTTLYLVKGADGEWKIDVSDPGNMDFANAVSGGAVDVAKSLQEFAVRYK